MGKKVWAAVLIALLGLAMAGCGRKAPAKEPDPAPVEAPAAEEQPPESTSIGGVRLDATREEAVQLLGQDYREEDSDEAGYYGEAQTVLNYADGIAVTVGRESGKVLRVEATGPAFTTELGVRCGDSAKEAADRYGRFYEQFEGMNSDGPLPGWFLVENGGLIILDIDRDDGSVFNESIGDGDKVEAIILAKAATFD